MSERTPPDDTTEGKALPETMLQPCSFDDSPEPTTAPVTAETATTEDRYWQAEAQRARAERDALALRLLQMADAWEERFTETGVRVAVVAEAVRTAVENAGGR